MSKMLDATCSSAGVVSVGSDIVEDAEILSEGTKASEGVLLIEKEKARYIASSATDIKDLITKMVAIVEQVATIATGLDGVTNSPGAQAAAIVQLQTLKSQLNASKEQLK